MSGIRWTLFASIALISVGLGGCTPPASSGGIVEVKRLQQPHNVYDWTNSQYWRRDWSKKVVVGQGRLPSLFVEVDEAGGKKVINVSECEKLWAWGPLLPLDEPDPAKGAFVYRSKSDAEKFHRARVDFMSDVCCPSGSRFAGQKDNETFFCAF